jgi:hypothetical protein
MKKEQNSNNAETQALNIPVVKPRIYLAILNITSWAGQCSDATHVYGELILCERAGVTVDNVQEHSVKYLGEGIEIQRPLTEKLAKELDKKSGGKSYQRAYRLVTENPEMREEMEYYGYTDRFDTFDEVVSAGVAKWKELDINCPFISLYEGEKYEANDYEPSTTVILQYGA